MNPDWTVIDGLQYSAWSREIFDQCTKAAQCGARHDCLPREHPRDPDAFGEWNNLRDVPRSDPAVYEPADIDRAKAKGASVSFLVRRIARRSRTRSVWWR